MDKLNIILAGVMGLDLSDVNHALFVAETTKDITDLRDFIDYCRVHKNGISFAGKTEKLDILATKYKKHELDKRLAKQYSYAELFSKELASKVKMCRNFVEDKCTTFKKIRVEGNRYFADKELIALKAIATQAVVIEYSKIGILEDAIYKFYMKRATQALLPTHNKHMISMNIKRF